jgi:ribosome maturation factor RimP
MQANALGLTLHEVEYDRGASKLRVSAGGAGIDELQALNTRLSAFIDNAEEFGSLPPFLLEVSSPGLSPSLRSDLDFSTFKGFEVTATLTEPFKGKIDWTGTLVGRDAEAVTLNLKGRLRSLPRVLVAEVRLPSAKREKGDTG